MEWIGIKGKLHFVIPRNKTVTGGHLAEVVCFQGPEKCSLPEKPIDMFNFETAFMFINISFISIADFKLPHDLLSHLLVNIFVHFYCLAKTLFFV